MKEEETMGSSFTGETSNKFREAIMTDGTIMTWFCVATGSRQFSCPWMAQATGYDASQVVVDDPSFTMLPDPSPVTDLPIAQ